MSEQKKISVLNTNIRSKKINGQDYFCITDIAKFSSPKTSDVLRNYIKNRSNYEFLMEWEQFHNPNFNYVQMDAIRKDFGTPTFSLSIGEWINKGNSIGIETSKGRYGGTYAHADITLQFTTWVSPKFHVYFIKEFQYLKELESNLELKQWDLRRELSKANHEIHTDAIQEYLSPRLTQNSKQVILVFASEIDLLNQAIFGMTAREFKQQNPDFKGNLRDWASTEQLAVLNNMQSLNAGMIEMGLSQQERFQIIFQRSLKELNILKTNKAFDRLKNK